MLSIADSLRVNGDSVVEKCWLSLQAINLSYQATCSGLRYGLFHYCCARSLAMARTTLVANSTMRNVDYVVFGGNAGAIARDDHSAWYSELFGVSVSAGIINASDLAGYRNMPVYVRGSKHTPPRFEAISELMAAFFELLENEPDPAVRVVLGHFVFVYIHPYVDGNGRIGRFLLIVAGGEVEAIYSKGVKR